MQYNASDIDGQLGSSKNALPLPLLHSKFEKNCFHFKRGVTGKVCLKQKSETKLIFLFENNIAVKVRWAGRKKK